MCMYVCVGEGVSGDDGEDYEVHRCWRYEVKLITGTGFNTVGEESYGR